MVVIFTSWTLTWCLWGVKKLTCAMFSVTTLVAYRVKWLYPLSVASGCFGRKASHTETMWTQCDENDLFYHLLSMRVNLHRIIYLNFFVFTPYPTYSACVAALLFIWLTASLSFRFENGWRSRRRGKGRVRYRSYHGWRHSRDSFSLFLGTYLGEHIRCRIR